jgi:hypothetical protein
VKQSPCRAAASFNLRVWQIPEAQEVEGGEKSLRRDEGIGRAGTGAAGARGDQVERAQAADQRESLSPGSEDQIWSAPWKVL